MFLGSKVLGDGPSDYFWFFNFSRVMDRVIRLACLCGAHLR